jgi:hypothetical protein
MRFTTGGFAPPSIHRADDEPVSEYRCGDDAADESTNQKRNANSHDVPTLSVKPHPAAYQDGQPAELSQSGPAA